MARVLEKAIKLGIYGTLLTPLIVFKATLFPFVFGKAIFFQTLIEILLILYLALLVLKPESRPKRSLLGIALVLYFAILALTTFTAVCPERAFYSTQERMTGLFNLLHFAGLFILLSVFFKTKKDWINLFRFFTLISFIVGVIAFQNLKQNQPSTFGNVGFLATYLIFAIFFAFYLMVKDKNLLMRAISFAPLFLSALLIYQESRRAALGAIVGGFALLLITHTLIVIKGRSRAKWLSVLLLICFAIFLFFGVKTPVFEGLKKEFLRGRETREISYSISFNAFKQKPILGWGPENYIYGFARHFEPKYAQYASNWFDKAHNQYFEALVTTGALGLVSYLSLFVITVWNFYKKREFIFIALIFAYMFNNFFWFDTTSSLIPLFITFAFSSWQKEQA